YDQDFGAYGIEVLFQDEGLTRIAELAAQEQTGARGLMTVCERVFRSLKFELPSTHVKRFVVSRELVDDTARGLTQMLAENEKETRIVARQIVHDFARRFQGAHGLKIQFTDAAADLLVAEALGKSVSVRDLCAEKFKDYQFGLKLVAQNTGQESFTIDHDAVAAPDQILSDWVV